MTIKAPQHVADVYATYPPRIRARVLELRKLVLNTAAETAGVGALEETLKWGEPAFHTKATGSGSTIRIAWKLAKPHHYAMYFNCQTNLVETFRTLFPNDFKFEGNRALVFALEDKIPKDSLAMCVVASLTYHLKKKEAACAK